MKNNYTFSKKMRTRAGVLSLLGMGIGTLLMTQNALAQPPGFGGEQGGPGGGQGGQGGRGGFGGPGGGQGGPGGFGGGGFQGGPGGFQGGRMGMLRTVSAASLPLRVMVSYLGLTDAQTGKIALVREDMQDAMRPQMGQRPGQPQGQPRGDSQGQQPQGRQGNQRSQGNQGNQGNPQAMQAAMQVAEKKATTEINAVLSDDQKTKLATLVKAIKALQDGGIRPDAALKLKLTEEQLAKLAGGTAVEEVLTTEQQNIAENYRMPAGGFGGGPGGPGGPGGFGGPPQGGPGQGGFGGGQGGFGSPPPPPDGSEGEVGGPEGNPPPSL